MFTAKVFGILIFGFATMGLLQGKVHGFHIDIIGAILGDSGQYPLGTTQGYFLHNTGVAMIAWLGGFAVIGPFYILWENGANIGSYIGMAFYEAHPNAAEFGQVGALAFLVPHGIFEIPAIILSISLGVYIAKTMLDMQYMELDYSMRDTFIVTVPYMLIVIGLLAIAAFIEANISVDFALMVGELL